MQRENENTKTLLYLIKERYGEQALHWCALRDGGEETLRYFLEREKPKHILEIGTHKGITTLLLAEYAEKVSTIDIQDHGVYEQKENVDYFICSNNEHKQEIIEMLDFDFVFIDGDHKEAGVAFDFECVRKCGRVLFHDYFANNERPNINGARQVVDELKEEGNGSVELSNIFAYWRHFE